MKRNRLIRNLNRKEAIIFYLHVICANFRIFGQISRDGSKISAFLLLSIRVKNLIIYCCFLGFHWPKCLKLGSKMHLIYCRNIQNKPLPKWIKSFENKIHPIITIKNWENFESFTGKKVEFTQWNLMASIGKWSNFWCYVSVYTFLNWTWLV